jgi:hypothetical protein
MDGRNFDAWLRSLTESRRSLVGGMLAAVGGSGLGALAVEAKHKKGKGKKHKKHRETCGHSACSAGQHCCDDQRGLCCDGNAECCNPGGGTGSCCAAPNACAPIYGGASSDRVCCPPERTFQTSVGLNVCCPEGEIATGDVTTSGPCCPQDQVGTDTDGSKYCCAVDGETVPCNGLCCQTGAVCCGGVYCCGLNGFICKSGCTNDPSGTGFACCHQDSQFCCPEGS